METVLIGVVGLGTMGLGIAQVFAQAGFPVLATDALPEARDSAAARLAASLAPRVAAAKLSAEAARDIAARLIIVPGPEEMGSAALVIEAVAERVEAKRALFALLETVVGPEAVLATNTSSLSVASVAAGLTRPERLVGLHFFNPAPAMKLVEIVAHSGTAPAPLARARALAESAGKVVIASPDRPGFIVNRCARPFYGEALALLEEGRTAAEIDAAMLAAGYRSGPFALIDLIGADIHLAATEGLARAMNFHPRYHVFAALKAQVAAGDLGAKTGRGFVFPAAATAAPADADEIVQRIEATLANEAASLLAEGGTDAASIDRAMTLGLNFPRGPFTAARVRGVERVLGRLRQLEATAPPHLKGRYAISPRLAKMA